MTCAAWKNRLTTALFGLNLIEGESSSIKGQTKKYHAKKKPALSGLSGSETAGINNRPGFCPSDP